MNPAKIPHLLKYSLGLLITLMSPLITWSAVVTILNREDNFSWQVNSNEPINFKITTIIISKTYCAIFDLDIYCIISSF